MKETDNKKEQHKQYTQVILLEKQINSSTIAYLLIYFASNNTYLSVHGQRLIHYYSASTCI